MDTICIHHHHRGLTDEEAELWLNGVVPPIYLSNGEKPSVNPTRRALEQTLTRLDGASQPALTYASGLAAASSICLTFLKKDDHAIIVDDAYSGVTHLFRAYLSRWSIQSSFVNLSTTPSIINAHFRSNTRLVWLESPSNPSMRLVDIHAISSLAHAHDSSIIVIVDNTFASPLNQSPLTLGADLCLSSLTKYINGHTDVVGGSISTNRNDLYEKLSTSRSLFDMNLSPFDCYLVRRGLNTLPVRMRQHLQSASQVAQFLERHPAVERVFYPALPSHPQHEIYQKQGGASGMCSYVLNQTADVSTFLKELQLCTVAVSLGGCETLIEAPSIMTHRTTLYGTACNEQMSDGLIRMSVGLEHVRDIIEDLDRALNRSIGRTMTDAPAIDTDVWELIEEAKRVSRRLHAVTAVLRTTSGRLYSGIHFQSSQASVIISAEVSAVSAMVNDGRRDLAIMVVLRGFDDEQNRFEIVDPRDRCEELLSDFNPNAEVIVGTVEKPYRVSLRHATP